MVSPAEPARPSFRLAIPCLVAALALAAAYGQAPLYYSNQNQYFLHGLAHSGHGQLGSDWLANTLDPTPLFSGLVAFTATWLHPWAFHLYHALLLGAYAVALVGIFAAVAGPEGAARRWPLFVLLLVLVHSAGARWLSVRLFGLDYPWYLQAGVAGQYVLGAMFQPSTFGVLLLVAISLFVHGRPPLTQPSPPAGGEGWVRGAAVCIALAATIHSTYLLPGALLTLGFLAALVADGRPRLALGVGALTLALVLPVMGYVLVTFAPTDSTTFAEAQDVLVNFRIPHHARADLWIDVIAGVQLAWIVLARMLVRRSPLALVLAVPFMLMVLLTLVQVATGSNTLALLFPWRITAVLMPVATAVILTRLVTLQAASEGEAKSAHHSPLLWASAVLLVGLGVAGVGISLERLAFQSGEEDIGLVAHVRAKLKERNVYFVPVDVPNLAKTTRGSLSSDFKSLADKRRDPRIIPVDLQRFRLATGAPIYVDFKSIPYKDTEVMEWRRRVTVAGQVTKQMEKGEVDADLLTELLRAGVTHLVQPAYPDRPELLNWNLTKVYWDPFYRVYRLKTAPASD